MLVCERGIIRRFREGEQRHVINLGFFKVLFALCMDMFVFNKLEVILQDRILLWCCGCTIIGVSIFSYSKEFLFNF